jgi:hypothetical protein
MFHDGMAGTCADLSTWADWEEAASLHIGQCQAHITAAASEIADYQACD